MPIIKARNLYDCLSDRPVDGIGTIDVQYQKDKIVFTHVEHIDPYMQFAYEARKNPNNGFSKDRTWRHIARIPVLEVIKHPEWFHDSKALKKWLKSPEGERFRVVRKGI